MIEIPNPRIPDRMRSGTVELPSGRWHWTLLPQWTGATIVFQHRDRVHDEMRNWTPQQEVTEEEALELAVEALERTWVDVDGLKWRLSLEFPSDWRSDLPGEASGRSSMWLAFKRGGLKKMVGIPEGVHLGVLSHTELKALLELACSPGHEVSS